jgi:hypothetical protein
LCVSVKEGYKVRSDLNISLEFRTSAENGVLLGISSAKVDAIGLEIVDGKVGASFRGPNGPVSEIKQPRCSFPILHFINGVKKRFHGYFENQIILKSYLKITSFVYLISA